MVGSPCRNAFIGAAVKVTSWWCGRRGVLFHCEIPPLFSNSHPAAALSMSRWSLCAGLSHQTSTGERGVCCRPVNHSTDTLNSTLDRDPSTPPSPSTMRVPQRRKSCNMFEPPACPPTPNGNLDHVWKVPHAQPSGLCPLPTAAHHSGCRPARIDKHTVVAQPQDGLVAVWKAGTEHPFTSLTDNGGREKKGFGRKKQPGGTEGKGASPRRKKVGLKGDETRQDEGFAILPSAACSGACRMHARNTAWRPPLSLWTV